MSVVFDESGFLMKKNFDDKSQFHPILMKLYLTRQNCNFPLSECQESPRDVFPQELSHLYGPNFSRGRRLANHA